MIICDKCGKENQDRYKFCLGCGAQLSPKPASPGPAEGAEGAVSTPKPPARVSGPAGLATTEPDTPEPAPREGTPQMDAALAHDPGRPKKGPTSQTPRLSDKPACPSCGAPNPPEFMFCGNCGGPLKQAARPGRGPQGGAETASKTSTVGKLALIKPDGSEGGTHPVTAPETMVGRGKGALFDNDSYLSPAHAKLLYQSGRIVVEDLDSLNGVFVKISREEPLADGDVFRIGQELLRYDAIGAPQLEGDGTEVMGSPNPGYWGRLSIVVGPDVAGSAFPLMGDEVVLGRERGDILFSDDGYVSGTHAKLLARDEGVFLVDLGSSNGTFIRLTAPREAPSGTFVLMGQQLFRLDYR